MKKTKDFKKKVWIEYRASETERKQRGESPIYNGTMSVLIALIYYTSPKTQNIV